MIRNNHIRKTLFALPLILAVQVVFAAFTSTISGHSNKKTATTKYSLNSVGKFSNRGLSLSSVRYSYQMKPVELGNGQNLQNGLSSNSSIEFTKGNTTFIFPYKVKVKVPKFKAPSLAGN